MKQRLFLLLTGLTVAVFLLLVMLLFMVRENEVVIVTTFGKIDRTITEAGLYQRWPWPVQKVHRYDNRLQLLHGTFDQMLTRDSKPIIMSVYAGWKITNPLHFFQRLGTTEKAENGLRALVHNAKNTILGRYDLSQLINVNKDELKFHELELAILDNVKAKAEDQYGIEIAFTGIRKIGLPNTVIEEVYNRMRAEREAISQRYTSEGEGEAIRIEAEAQSKRDQILAEAEAKAKSIRAEGEAAAAEYYEAFEKNPGLHLWLKKLESAEKMMKEKTEVIISDEYAPFDVLENILKGNPGIE